MRCGAALVLAAALLLGGCGDPGQTPAQSVPELATALRAIDSQVADGHWARARAQLRALIAKTEAAREAGELDDAEADRIVAAATRMLAALPTPTPTPSATPTATPKPTATKPAPEPKPEPKKGEDKGKGGGRHGRN